METPEQERARVEYSITAVSRGITLGKQRFAKIEQREKAAAAEITRLQAALEVEQAERADVQQRLDALASTVTATGAETARDVEKLDQEVDALSWHAYASTVKKSAPVSKRITVVRDAVHRATELVEVEDGATTATVKTIHRDKNFRIVGMSVESVPVIDEPEDVSGLTDANDPAAVARLEESL